MYATHPTSSKNSKYYWHMMYYIYTSRQRQLQNSRPLLSFNFFSPIVTIQHVIAHCNDSTCYRPLLRFNMLLPIVTIQHVIAHAVLRTIQHVIAHCYVSTCYRPLLRFNILSPIVTFQLVVAHYYVSTQFLLLLTFYIFWKGRNNCVSDQQSHCLGWDVLRLS